MVEGLIPHLQLVHVFLHGGGFGRFLRLAALLDELLLAQMKLPPHYLAALLMRADQLLLLPKGKPLPHNLAHILIQEHLLRMLPPLLYRHALKSHFQLSLVLVVEVGCLVVGRG